MIGINQIYNIDCLVGMQDIDDKSIDMILCDLPYGTTACKWDTVIPFEPLWKQYKRIIKDNGAIVLTGSQPFTTDLIMSNREWFRYEIIWQKTVCGNPLTANIKPMKAHENICVFYKKQPTYIPQWRTGLPYKDKARPGNIAMHGQQGRTKTAIDNPGRRYPHSVIEYANPNNNNIHDTQKPVPLFEYLIRTYTNEGDLVLDNCMGSGTTAIASMNTGRNYIGFELDKTYFDLSQERIRLHGEQKRMAI